MISAACERARVWDEPAIQLTADSSATQLARIPVLPVWRTDSVVEAVDHGFSPIVLLNPHSVQIALRSRATATIDVYNSSFRVFN